MKRLSALAALLLAAPVPAATIAITGGTVLTGIGEQSITGGTVIITDGRITAVGTGIAVPAGATVIDARGKTLTPGIIAGMSDLGIDEVGGVRETTDSGARTAPWSAALDLSVAINPNSVHIPVNRMGGVTRALVGPGAESDIFGGQGVVITLAQGAPAVMRPRAFQFVELGEQGGDLAGGSRPAAWVTLTTALAEAARYAANPAGYDRGLSRDSLAKAPDIAALVPVLKGTMPLVVHVERASDIVQVLGLKTRYPALRPILIGAREAWLVAGKIAAAGVPVITLSLFDLPSDFETLASSRSNVGLLQAAGVTVAMGVFGGDSGAQPRNLPYFAGNAAAQAAVPGASGLTRGQALATITANPARIFGLDDLGTLSAGKRGDVVIWDGDPLDVTGAPVAVLIDGVAQPMRSRQTDLAERYKSLGRSDLPLQYPR